MPQGSVLGPFLFSLYINNITNIHLSEGTKLSLYADDILLYKDASVWNVFDLQNDIDKLQSWSFENKTKFNEAKCKYMIISRRRLATDFLPTLFLNSQPLELVKSYKYLGVTLTSDLTWTLHIKQATVKARKVIGMLYIYRCFQIQKRHAVRFLHCC